MKFSHMLMVAAAPFLMAACGGPAEEPTPSVSADAPPLEETLPPETDTENGWDEAGVTETVDREASVWQARGNEPGWTLTLDGAQMVFSYNYGEKTINVAEPAPVEVEGGMTYTASEHGLVATVLNTVCQDDMSGMPYPSTVTVELAEGGSFKGCGGEPEALLAGADWKVESINKAAVADGTDVTLIFDTVEKRVSGKSGCNSYGAPYTLTGEGLSFGIAISTEMACPEPAMTQEKAFHDALKSVTNFVIEEDGALVLTNHDSAEIRARR